MGEPKDLLFQRSSDPQLKGDDAVSPNQSSLEKEELPASTITTQRCSSMIKRTKRACGSKARDRNYSSRIGGDDLVEALQLEDCPQRRRAVHALRSRDKRREHKAYVKGLESKYSDLLIRNKSLKVQHYNLEKKVAQAMKIVHEIERPMRQQMMWPSPNLAVAYNALQINSLFGNNQSALCPTGRNWIPDNLTGTFLQSQFTSRGGGLLNTTVESVQFRPPVPLQRAPLPSQANFSQNIPALGNQVLGNIGLSPVRLPDAASLSCVENHQRVIGRTRSNIVSSRNPSPELISREAFPLVPHNNVVLPTHVEGIIGAGNGLAESTALLPPTSNKATPISRTSRTPDVQPFPSTSQFQPNLDPQILSLANSLARRGLKK